jgi:hypothetical protein
MLTAAFTFAAFSFPIDWPLHPGRIALGILGAVGLFTGILVFVVRRHRAHHLYHKHVHETQRERLLISAIGFCVAFATVRVLTHAIHAGRGPFHDISMGGRHIHHLVWGILLLLLVGYAWLLQVGTGQARGSRVMGGVMSFFYGVGAALTLDEFALWLNLRDVYWDREGRASIDAVILFGGLLSIGIWGGPFLRALIKEAACITSGKASGTPPHP